MVPSSSLHTRELIHVPNPYPAFGLDLVDWRPPTAVLLQYAEKKRSPEGWDTLTASLAPLGHRPDDIACIGRCPTSWAGCFLEYGFPKILDWSKLPMVGDAQWA